MTSRFVEDYIWILESNLKKIIVNFNNLLAIKKLSAKSRRLSNDSKLKNGKSL
jgi:hypothetical protein